MSVNVKGGSKAASLSLDLVLLVLLLAAGLAVRWLYLDVVIFPPLDEPAFYLTTGEGLLTGKGLEIDVLGAYQPRFPGVTHPSHEHWMPLTTGLVAAAFAIQRAVSGTLEASLQVGQLPGLILGAMLAPLTYVVGRRALPDSRHNRWIALGAGLLITVNASLSYQSADAGSSAPFAFFAAWALALAIRKPGDQGGYFGAGLLIGLAYLARSDGLLLLLAIPLAWWLLPTPKRSLIELPDNPAAQQAWELWPREKGSEEDWARTLGPSLANVLDLVVAFALVAAGWLVRNYVAFGTPLPTPLLSQIWLTDYVETFNFVDHPTWQAWLAQGWPALLAQRADALLHNGGVFLQVTFPWGLLALPGLWLLRREWLFFPALVYSLLLFFGTALLTPAASMAGAFSQTLGAAIPLLTLAAVYAVGRGLGRLFKNRALAGTALAAVTAGLLVLEGAQMFQSLPAVTERHQAEQARFEAAAAWLAQHAAPDDVIMSTRPYTLNYASGHPAIVLPGSEPPDAAWQAARRYKAKYLVITEAFGQYPQILHDQPDPRFTPLHADGDVEIYAISQ